MDYLAANFSGVIVDAVLSILALSIFTITRSYAAIITSVANLGVLFYSHLFVFITNGEYQFAVDYHLSLAAINAAFLAFVIVKVNCYSLLKCAIGLNFLLHTVMIIKEPLQQMYLLSPNGYNVIYSTYEESRILIVSLQITGLINGDSRSGGFDSFNSRIRAHARRILNHFNLSTKILLRVKKQ